MNNTIMLRTESLTKTFTLHLQGGIRISVLSDIDLEIRAGECVALSGPSGAGKSTLMRSLYGNYRADSGNIFIRHQEKMINISGADPRIVLAVRAESIFYVSQFLRVVPRVSALDIVAEIAIARGQPVKAARKTAAALLTRLNISARMQALPPATFSGGEQQRVNLARGFIGGYPILLLDEPTAALDPANRAVVIDMILEKKSQGVALVGIFHDADMREAVADRLFPITPLQDAA